MKLQKGLDDLIIKYSVGTAAALSESGESTVINGEEYPLLPWESERRFYEMKNTFETRLGNPCTFRVGYTAHRGTDLFALLRREIGVIEYVLSSDIKSIYAVRGGSAMNCIATAANGCICTLELAATLCAEDKEIDKHELMTDAATPATVLWIRRSRRNPFMFTVKAVRFIPIPMPSFTDFRSARRQLSAMPLRLRNPPPRASITVQRARISILSSGLAPNRWKPVWNRR